MSSPSTCLCVTFAPTSKPTTVSSKRWMACPLISRQEKPSASWAKAAPGKSVANLVGDGAHPPTSWFFSQRRSCTFEGKDLMKLSES